jgi:BirA family biotin operon repressor/biotin-[acetyl-CoA-carboxylase] ligase
VGELLNEGILRDTLGRRPFRFEPQTGSTNDDAIAWAQLGAPEGAVVISEEQLSGRGRMGRMWVAPPGSSLLVSVVLRPTDPALINRITILGAVAVWETLNEFIRNTDVVAQLKWPNDVLLNQRKVAGVLAEATWLGSKLEAVALGMGINVRLNFANTPLAGRATSIEMATGRQIDRAALLARLVERIDYWSARLGDPALHKTWEQNLDTIGRTLTVQSADEEYHGVATAVGDDGTLVLETDDGEQRIITAGDVTLLD